MSVAGPRINGWKMDFVEKEHKSAQLLVKPLRLLVLVRRDDFFDDDEEDLVFSTDGTLTDE